MAADRPSWKKRVHALRNGVSRQNSRAATPATHSYRTRSKDTAKPPATQPKNNNNIPVVKRAISSLSEAKKYITRDAHEAFFRPGDGSKRRRPTKQTNPRKRKKPSLTNKQRSAAAHEYYAKYHAPDALFLDEHDPTINTPTTPIIAWTPPKILGHHRSHNDPNTTMAPIQ